MEAKIKKCRRKMKDELRKKKKREKKLCETAIKQNRKKLTLIKKIQNEKKCGIAQEKIRWLKRRQVAGVKK